MTDATSRTGERRRICPDCGSVETRLVQRGLAGPTDEADQYFVCLACGRVTYEIVSRTYKEIRIGRLEIGRPMRIDGQTYEIVRVLRAGVSESLIYVKPMQTTPPAIPPRPARR